MDAFNQAEFLKYLAAMLALLNPLYGLPVFISMTDGFTIAERRRTALIVTATVAATGLASILLGEELLAIFGISVPAFRVAGGVIIFGIGIAMLNAAPPAKGDSDAIAAGHAAKNNIAVVPLAIPLTIGPGAIVTSIVFAHQLSDAQEVFTLTPALMVLCLLMGVALWFAVPIAKFLGPTVISIVTRVMAIVLAAVAVEMILDGIGDAIDARYPELLQQTTGS